jgi:glycosyltransferase involved in cell wall biosynthesis
VKAGRESSNAKFVIDFNVLFISRATLFQDRGGDTIQVLETAKHLKNLGLKVDIKLANEQIDYAPYTLIHFFNIIRPADILIHIKKSGKPFVISPIYVDYAEMEKVQRKGIAGTIFKLLSKDAIEYLKVLARFMSNGERIISSSYIFLGQKRSIRRIIRHSSMLLPNSNNEYRRLAEDYHIDAPYKVIPNAIDSDLFRYNHGSYNRDANTVLCVGRIEYRKNQLNLIRALNNTKYQLLIIGPASTNQQRYVEECRKIASSNISFIDSLPQEELLAYYMKAKVHALPSWFETTGLSSLEAAAMGCNLVITDKGDTREYFGNYAFYCDPNSPASIFAAIEMASSSGFNELLRESIYSKYTWPKTAEKTLGVYRDIVG